MLKQLQSQKLTVRADPQLLLTNTLLQMSRLELEQRLEAELAENPALEVGQAEPALCSCKDRRRVDPLCPLHNAVAALPHAEAAPARPEGPALTVTEPVTARSAWPWENASGDDDDVDPLSLMAHRPTLQEGLCEQFRAVGEDADYRIAEYLIDSIDPRGWLGCTVEDAAGALGVSVSDVERVLAVVQTLEPSGVAARDLRECLLLQIAALRQEGAIVPPLVESLLRDHFKLLADGRIKRVAAALRQDVEVVERAVRFIQTCLSPYPGEAYRTYWDRDGHKSRNAVAPDAVIRRNEEGDLEIALVEYESTQLRVSPQYARLWRALQAQPRAGVSEAERQHVQDAVARAQMFLRSISQRKALLVKVLQCIIEEQEAFFHSEREEDLRPLTQTRLAGVLHVHESTISRSVADKYVQMPSGQVLPLAKFFGQSTSLKTLVRQILEAEDPRRPLSDQQISDLLRSRGIRVARRTVMKYREELNILSSRERAREAA